jgi:hypothetical protein
MKAFIEDGTHQNTLASVIAVLQRNRNNTDYRAATETLNVQDMNWLTPPYENPIYQWYHITEATFWHGGKLCISWRNIVHATLSGKQIIITNGIEDAKGRVVDIGYWVSPSEKERYGKIYATSLCCLTLMVQYRYGGCEGCGCQNRIYHSDSDAILEND